VDADHSTAANRPVTRYQTDLTDAEWRVIAPHFPKPCATGRPVEFLAKSGAFDFC
jgi:transposase